MDIRHAGAEPPVAGASEHFTGAVRIDMLFRPREGWRTSGGAVTFEAGARTHWHTHPLGQILLVTAGHGWAQREGAPREDIRPGDVVWFPPGEKHWHGAATDSAMTHVAITQAQGDTAVDWLEPVTEAQYAGRAPG